MRAIRPRALAHRGTVEAAGFLFNVNLIGEQEARRRVLDLWSPGALVYRLQGHLAIPERGDLLLQLPGPHMTRCEFAGGTPLMLSGGVLFAAPLAADELRALAAPAGSVVLVRGAEARVVRLTAEMAEPLETWIDIEPLEVINAASLGPAAAKPRLVVETPAFEPRVKLKGVPEPAPEMEAMRQALRSGRGQTAAGAPRGERGGGAGVREAAAGLLSGLAATLERLGAFFRLPALGSRVSQAPTGRRSRAPAAPVAPAKPPPFQRISAILRRMAARVLSATRLSSILGREQARYLMRMAEMFERGELNEALRHAIPIDGELSEALSSPKLGLLRPRTDLTISVGGRTASSSIALETDWLTYFRKLYRASFERLAAQGRIEEAAFVLAELLQANEEAVAFLERHGRLRLAAEMAEARGLPPGLVVRQWFVAGDRARAISIARRTGAFADAVTRLERSDKKQGETLRLLWGAALADGGDYAGAVEAVWPVEAARRLARDWMDKAIEIGGPVGSRMLARKVNVVPEAFDEIRDRALGLLDDESIEGEPARRAFAMALVREAKTPQSRALARAAARAMCRDAGQGGESGLEQLTATQLRLFVDYAGDPALRADFPPIPRTTPSPLEPYGEPRRIEFAATDGGTMPGHDIAFLPDGKTVVALGEAGVRLLTRDGRTVAHFDQPAHRLVISDHGDRAIALARRGEVWKLARLDFLSRKAETWCEARVDAFAADYDGVNWFVAAEHDFYAIDATAKRFDALWRVPDLEGAVVAIARSPSQCRFLLRDWGIEEWAYQLPQMTLRRRESVRLDPEEQKGDDENTILVTTKTCVAIAAEGHFVDQSSRLRVLRPDARDLPDEKVAALIADQPPLQLRLFANGALYRTVPLEGSGLVPENPVIAGGRAVARYKTDQGMRMLVVDLPSGRRLVDIVLAGADEAAARLSNGVLSVADSRGRVLVFSAQRGLLMRDLRI